MTPARGDFVNLSDYTRTYRDEIVSVTQKLDLEPVDRMIEILASLRESEGRLFVLGVGGGAANAGHAVNDFRKIAGIEAYAPTDNVSELTARVNDDGWETSFRAWLLGSRLRPQDVVFVFSVGGGDLRRGISANLVRAVEYAKTVGARVIGIVGRDGGYTAAVADACVIVPTVNAETVTPHTEAFQAVIWHLMVSHPKLQQHAMKWESVL
jgi:D-sedoheptulose 7-phosphate isomerase